MKYIVRYGEIGIKSPKIRRKFENKLIQNIQTDLSCEFQNDYVIRKLHSLFLLMVAIF